MFLRGHQHDIGIKSVGESEHRNALMQGGGKTQVPCLRIETSEGKVSWMYESDDILSYINEQQLLS